MKRVAVLVGSLRKESWTRKLVLALKKLAPDTLAMEIVEIGNLPIYNPDLDENAPQGWISFREQMKNYDAFLFATPEYNRSVPGVLKNAIDVGSRPYGKSVWNAKPGAVISCSPGAIGGFGANHHLRQSLVFLDVPCLQQPEIYISFVDKKIDESGNLIKEDTKELLQKFLNAFTKWIDVNSKK